MLNSIVIKKSLIDQKHRVMCLYLMETLFNVNRIWQNSPTPNHLFAKENAKLKVICAVCSNAESYYNNYS